MKLFNYNGSSTAVAASNLYCSRICAIGDSLVEQSASDVLKTAITDTTPDVTDAGLKIGSGDYGWLDRVSKPFNLFYAYRGTSSAYWYGKDTVGSAVYMVNKLLENKENEKYDYIVLKYDGISSSFYGNQDEPANENSNNNYGAIRYCLETLNREFPNSKVIVITPCHFNGPGGTPPVRQDEYYRRFMPVFADYNVTICDMREAGLTAADLVDGIHLGFNHQTEGHRKYAKRLITAIIEAS